LVSLGTILFILIKFSKPSISMKVYSSIDIGISSHPGISIGAV